MSPKYVLFYGVLTYLLNHLHNQYIISYRDIIEYIHIIIHMKFIFAKASTGEGGGGGIRTHESPCGDTALQAVPLNHSGTPPCGL